MKRWLIRDIEGGLTGPLSTQELFAKISDGNLSGEEEISLFPGGEWKKISQETEFYDFLLKVLSGDSPSLPEEDPSAFVKDMGDKEPQLENLKEEDLLGYEDVEKVVRTKKKLRKRRKIQAKDIQHQPSEKFVRPDKKKVVRLYNKQDLKKRGVRRGFISLLFPIVLVITLFAIAYSLSVKNESGEVSFISPKFGKEVTFSRSKTDLKMKKAIILFSKDAFSAYVNSQNELVSVIEGNPREKRAFALLCMTYLELWPYVSQNAKNLNVVEMVRKEATLLDPYGMSGATCDVVYYLIKSNWKKALEKTELVLSRWSSSENLSSTFYYFKARLLVGGRDFVVALDYIDSLQKRASSWVRAFFYECEILELMGRWDEAAAKYRLILKSNPNHVLSRLRLALIEYKNFHHTDMAIKMINQALKQGEKVLPSLLLDTYIVLGEAYVKKGSLGKALDAYRKAEALSPENPLVVSALKKLGSPVSQKKSQSVERSKELLAEGDHFLRGGDCKAAQAYYKSSYEANRKNGLAALKAGECLWDIGVAEEAIVWVNKSIKAEPELIEAYVVLARYYSQRNDFELALATLSRARGIRSKSYEIYKGYSEVELARRNPKLALKYANVASKIYSADEEVYILMAKAQLILGPEEVHAAYANAIKSIELNSINKDGQITYARALGKIQGAGAERDYLSKKIQEYPLEIEYQMALGKAFLRDEQFEAAVQLFSRAVDTNRRSKKAWLGLGEAYEYSNNFRKAEEAYLKAAFRDPSDPIPLFRVGQLYARAKKYRASIKYFQQAIEVNGQYPQLHYYLGKTFLALGKLDKAIKEANIEKQNNPYLEHSYILLAKIYTKKGVYKRCVDEYQKVIDVRPVKDHRNANIYVNLAICYRKLGNLEVAKDMLKEAEVIQSGYPDIFKEFGVIFELEGNKNLAVDAFEKYLLLKPGASDASIIRKRIGSIF